jgi:hypothetical protein
VAASAEQGGEIAGREATVGGRLAEGLVDSGGAADLGQRDGSAIFMFILAVPAAAASSSQACAPAPMARNCVSAALRGVIV